MTSLTSPTHYTRQTIGTTVQETTVSPDVVIIPTLTEMHEPARRIMRTLQFRRRLSQYMADVISSFASL